MTQDHLRTALLEAKVPRYTSYPPATRFSGAIGPDIHAGWLAALPPEEGISLYAHVPFCRRLCWFCACRTQGTANAAPLTRFLETLAAEAALVARAVGRAQKVAALHLGGGTPTLLTPEQIDRMGQLLRENFDLSACDDISVEIDPCELDAARLDALVAFGLSRASIGVQDIDPVVQNAIGRHQSAEITAEAVAGLRARGIGSVNFDLLYGLPYQTEARLAATLDAVIAHRPDRIALYGYAHVPWMARRQKLIPEDALPDPEARIALADLARARLIGSGYVPVGIDHYALPGDEMARAAQSGTLRRNFQGYTTDRAATLVALGPSAISRLPQGYAQNASATRDWTATVEAGVLPTARGYALTAQDRLAADAIERVMCDGTVDFTALGRAHGLPTTALTTRAATALAELPGMGTLAAGVLQLADMRYARLMAARIDPGMAGDTGRFSMAS
ncbi:oxygen-independent coproporphyrinogen-3 oxidase [Roseivivax lentus]|uniref:Coproporphyrinogen-III oxidase n=1 Tax=Roseivivax lentus TaxID=633194 RepID=A0A1N7MRG0_9RHOB|nr:oxygen-independent coproporphyrinogen III oxidase [Roseivivax lentus]SIS88608.1 oxygen-independent coproporphyrinogen-3 oxidase [Roseivivax lentus]